MLVTWKRYEALEKNRDHWRDTATNNTHKLKETQLELKTLDKKLKEEFEFKEKKAVAALEQKLEKEKIKYEKGLQSEMAKFKEEELTKMYDKLSSSLTKLHEEGNANSKFIQEMNLSMANALMPAMAGSKQIESK